jgi:hypothetical protein
LPGVLSISAFTIDPVSLREWYTGSFLVAVEWEAQDESVGCLDGLLSIVCSHRSVRNRYIASIKPLSAKGIIASKFIVMKNRGGWDNYDFKIELPVGLVANTCTQRSVFCPRTLD